MASVLYFIKGEVPTPEEMADATRLGTAKFRNALLYSPGDSLEICDGVAGSPPAAYLEKYAPTKTEEPTVKPVESVPASPLTSLDADQSKPPWVKN